MLKIENLIALQKILNITELCKQAGLNKSKLFAKIRNNRELTVPEAEIIEKVLKDFGLGV